MSRVAKSQPLRDSKPIETIFSLKGLSKPVVITPCFQWTYHSSARSIIIISGNITGQEELLEQFSIACYYSFFIPLHMNQERVKRSYCSSTTKDMALRVLLPISIFALLSGTFPTDTALLHYMEQSTHLTNDSANHALSIKTYSAICFIAPGVLLILAYGPRVVMFTGSLAQLFCILMWFQANYFPLTQVCSVLAGYGSATWIACCCYGRQLLPNEHYLLYYGCIGFAFLVGQFVATVVDALAQASVIGPLLPFVLAATSSAFAGFICITWVPIRKYHDNPRGAVYQEAIDPRLWPLRTCQYWRQLGSTFVVAIKKSPLCFLILWFTLEYAVLLSVQATITDFLFAGSVNGSENGFDPLFNSYMLALSLGIGSVMTAVTILLRPILSGNCAELFIGLMALASPPFLLGLHFVRGRLFAAYWCYLVFIACASLQLASGLVKIANYLSFEVNVVVYGAMTLLALLVKIMFISIGLSFALYSGIWLAFTAQFCFVAMAYRGLLMKVAPLVLLPPAPIVLEDARSPISLLSRAEGSPALEVREGHSN